MNCWRETARLARELLGAAPGLAALAIALAGGVAAGALPLLEVPGWELGQAAALLAVPGGVALGIAAARRAPGEPVAAAAGAALVLCACLLVLFGAASIRAGLFTPCRASAGAALFWATALPSALLAVALGVAAAAIARGRRLPASLLAAATALCSLALTLSRAWAGPSAAARDHLLGIWPGPVYDEALALDGSLLLFRAGTIAWAALLLAVALGASRSGRSPARLAALAATSLVAAVLAGAAGGELAGREQIVAALGGRIEGPRCEVFFPREKRREEAERLLRDCEAAAARIAATLEIARPPRTRVFVHRGPEEKRRLTGAGRTSFTKPWLSEIHVNDEPPPRSVLRHELVHAIAAAAAEGPLRVPARALFLVETGLVEGLAAALEPPAGAFTPHEWARAMRDLGLLPRPEEMLGQVRFFGAAPARAYAAAGSFVAFLLQRRGPAAVKALYARGDFRAALGGDPAALAGEWAGFLDGVSVPPGLAAAAEQRFREPSLFERACGREQAGLAEAARGAARAGRPEEAEADLRRLSDLAGGDPWPMREAGDAWRSRDRARARQLYQAALAGAERTGARRALRVGLLASLGDLAAEGGDLDGAAERWRAALALGPDDAEARILAAKLAAAKDPSLAAAALPWLLGRGDEGVALARLAASPAPLARYLLARAVLSRGAPRRAGALLAGLDPATLPSPALAAEARRLAAEARCDGGDFAGGAAAFDALAAGATRGAERERAREAAWRCRFEEREFGGAIEGPSDWPGSSPGR